jgi:hypothetical protein
VRGRKGEYGVLIGKPEGKRSLERPRCRWKKIILKLSSRKARGRGVGWIDPAQDRDRWRALVNATLKIQVPYNSEKFLGYMRNYQLIKKDAAPWNHHHHHHHHEQ